MDFGLLGPEQPRRIRREEYDRMVSMGLFDDERVELLHGVIVSMCPNDPPHSSPVQDLTMLIVPALVGRAIVRVQQPIIAFDDSEPEPDIAVVPLGDYHDAHPAQAHLVIEVADSSLRKDRLVKAPLYARSGFLEYWLVSVRDGVVEVYREADGSDWRSVTRHGRDETLHPIAFPDVALRIASFLA
ncbi:MAG: Uma2 family endonuclease [Deltaproteobacteria bacterium]|nr:Uma2 family endonuclease [Deltaproteobacteria bacterium]